METSLLDQGVTLMIVGMGTVFVFLTILVIAMSLLSAMAVKLASSPDNDGPSDEEIAAMTAAISLHKK